MKRLLLLLTMHTVSFGACATFTAPAFAAVSSTASRVDFTADGSATVYGFTFKTPKATWLEVYLAGVKQSTGFTITLNANQATSPGGSVTFSSAPAAATAVRIQRVVPLTQETIFTPYSPFASKTVEGTLDRLVMQDQQLDRAVIDTKTTSDAALTASASAVTNSSTALSTANSAAATANTAIQEVGSGQGIHVTSPTSTTRAVHLDTPAPDNESGGCYNSTTFRESPDGMAWVYDSSLSQWRCRRLPVGGACTATVPALDAGACATLGCDSAHMYSYQSYSASLQDCSTTFNPLGFLVTQVNAADGGDATMDIIVCNLSGSSGTEHSCTFNWLAVDPHP